MFIVLGLALFVAWVWPRFWLFGALALLAALIGLLSGPSEQEVRAASVLVLIGIAWVAVRKTALAFWRVERESWDQKDRR